MSKPGQIHWEAVKWLLRYIKGAIDIQLVYSKDEDLSVQGFCDSDYAADLDRSRSISGYKFTVGGNVSAICLSKNRVFHERTKHMAVKYNFIRDIIEEGTVEVVKIHTSRNPADILTKVVPVSKFREALDLLRVRA
ncbi:unnamed protein product [Microthlaspi erraticum]|uniref:Reverse transcriptase Ty1/copia-type domain-containing protein n=1 Tax=Microthlaspi erraticum TaxID=1685480 RepID=A0A6D2HIT6_9BRAS|nr:unnamed protein product [Microthlaspi erraticum]